MIIRAALALMGAFFALASTHGATLTWSNGTGNWDFDTTAWNANTVKWTDDNDAVFAGMVASGTITLIDDISANSLQFNQAGYEITSDGNFALTLGSQIIFGQGAGEPGGALLSVPVSGTGNLTISGEGELSLYKDLSDVDALSSPQAGIFVNHEATLSAVSLSMATAGDGTSKLRLADGAVVILDNGEGTGTFGSGAIGASVEIGSGCDIQAVTLNGNFSPGLGAVTFANNDDLYFGSGISGNFAVVKQGAGILTLDRANTYAGGTLIDEGTLSVENDAGSATGTGAVTIDSGGTLAGYGGISGAVMLSAAGNIAPGYSDRLQMGSLSWSAGGVVTLGLSDSTDFSDRLIIQGTLTKVGNSPHELVLSDAGAVNGTTYALITFGSKSGFVASDFSVSGIEGKLTLTATQLLFRAGPDPVYAATVTVAKRKTGATFTLKNKGNTATTFKLKTANRTKKGGVKFTYKMNGKDVTSAIKAGKAISPVLKPGKTVKIVLTAKPSKAGAHPTFTAVFTATSVVSPSSKASATAVLKL